MGLCGPRGSQADVELERLVASGLCALEGVAKDGDAPKATGDQTHVRFCQRCPDECFEKQTTVFTVSFERGSLVRTPATLFFFAVSLSRICKL